MRVNEGTPTMSFVLNTINVEFLCDTSYVTWKYRQYRRYPEIFVRKYKTFQKINIPGARFDSSGASFFRFVPWWILNCAFVRLLCFNQILPQVELWKFEQNH